MLVKKLVPGGAAQAMNDADSVSGSYLPALSAWQFGPEQAAAISQPVLSVPGTGTERLFVEGRELLHRWFPQVEDCPIQGVALLQGVAGFFARHPMADR